MLYSVIMAGGSGTRFWPESRKAFPKQLLPIGSDRPLVEETVNRITELCPPERILIITNKEYKELTQELLPQLPKDNVVGEPMGRDTSACIGLAALILKKRDPEAVMAVMPSDHIIKPASQFIATLKAAESLLKTRKNALLTFGIQPTYAATGYGYIKRGPHISEEGGVPFFEVDSFEEKPEQETAEDFVKQGAYFWNAGIFVWRADAILDRMKNLLPELHTGLLKLQDAIDTPSFQETMDAIYPTLKKESIDYGIMEKAKDRIVAKVSYSWDDVGSWTALERLLKKDGNNNFVQGACVSIKGAKNNIVSAKKGMVGLIGVEGLIVVHTRDATLVCKKEDAEKVKALVNELESQYL